eukprot:3087597-Rhodomonas_salina.1
MTAARWRTGSGSSYLRASSTGSPYREAGKVGRWVGRQVDRQVDRRVGREVGREGAYRHSQLDRTVHTY